MCKGTTNFAHMQAFGHFSSNKMEFYGLNGIMGLYACIKMTGRAEVQQKNQPALLRADFLTGRRPVLQRSGLTV